MIMHTGDLYIHVNCMGPADGEPLLLLHSLGTDMRVWDPQAQALAARFRVVRLDLRGHGLSDVPEGPYTIEQMARDVLKVLDGLEIMKCHVGGLSVGGMVAQSMAAQAPHRVASLVLVDTAMAIPPAQAWIERAAAVRKHGTGSVADAVVARWVTPAYLAVSGAHALRAMLLSTKAEGYAATAEAIAAADLQGQTRQLRMPALVLVGEHDVATPVAEARALAQAIPGARMQVIPGAAHIPTLQAAGAITEAMTRFLATVADPFTPLQVRV